MTNCSTNSYDKEKGCIYDELTKIYRLQTVREEDCIWECGRNKIITIPFILYCKGNCEPFEAMGNEFCTIFFRLCFISKNCITLELLRPKGCYGCGKKFPALCRTRELLTFDLNCFCGIQCLKAFEC